MPSPSKSRRASLHRPLVHMYKQIYILWSTYQYALGVECGPDTCKSALAAVVNVSKARARHPLILDRIWCFHYISAAVRRSPGAYRRIKTADGRRERPLPSRTWRNGRWETASTTADGEGGATSKSTLATSSHVFASLSPNQSLLNNKFAS